VLKKNVAVLVAALFVSGAAGACSQTSENTNGATNKTTNAPAVNTNTAATSNTNAGTGVVVDIPADVQPIYAAKCAGCHGQDGKGNKVAPSVLEIADKHTADEWAAYLKDTKIWEKDNKMPVVKLTDEELKTLSAWIASNSGKAPSAGTSTGEKDDKSEKGGKGEKSEKSEKSEGKKSS
jgi:mono/diheme cytochrome c family protein